MTSSGWTTVAGGTTPEYVAGTDTAKYTMTLDPDQHLYAVYAVRNDTKYTVEHYRVGVVLNANGTIKHVINVEDTPIYTTTQIGTTEATGTGLPLTGGTDYPAPHRLQLLRGLQPVRRPGLCRRQQGRSRPSSSF